VDQRRGIWHDPAFARSTSVRDWAGRWFDQHSASLRTSTVDSYKGLLETGVLDRTGKDKQVGLGDLVLQSLTPMRVGEWLAQLQRDGLSASRVRQTYRVLSSAMDAAMRERLLAYGGLRVGEARALRRRHIDVLGGKLIVEDVYRHPGLGVTPHSLRASCASWVAESDGVLEAARRLGHNRSSVTTRHYARPMTGGDAVVAERLDATRTGARATVIDPVGPSEWARSGPDGRTTPGKRSVGERRTRAGLQ